MAVKTTKVGEAVVLNFEGTVDGKVAIEMEKAIAASVTPDVRFVVADMEQVQLLTSAGIRQFLLLRKRMASARGGLVLCAVNERVKTLLEIAGLLSQFTLADTRASALAALPALQQGVPEPPPPASKIGSLLFSILGGQDALAPRAGEGQGDAAVDALVSHLNAVLGGQGGSPAKASERG
jgi:anti-sigma B factor antagonist